MAHPKSILAATLVLGIVSADANAETVTLVCANHAQAQAGLSEIYVIDFAKKTVDIKRANMRRANFPDVIPAEITEDTVRFVAPDGSYVTWIDRTTGQRTGAVCTPQCGTRLQDGECRRQERQF